MWSDWQAHPTAPQTTGSAETAASSSCLWVIILRWHTLSRWPNQHAGQIQPSRGGKETWTLATITHLLVLHNLYIYKKKNNVFTQIWLKLVKTFIMLHNISNKCCSLEMFYSSKKYFLKILSSTNVFNILIIFRNVSWAPNQHIRMISARTLDTEDE